ncbi:MAG TPA: cytochrome b/b6 domain-containing protein [Bryobacteraceae bacterium]|jgi:thiosulfate reductase cytochrome b subunit|nr:cytochrome b/b6 domain-containing protein [Bryobacteraceae bacterium]
MADSGCLPGLAAEVPKIRDAPRHTLLVRLTHWLTAACFFALLVSGMEIVVSHPRFYWGEAGNALTPPLFHIPIPSSRATVPTGYKLVLPDQNGWSRALHFQTAWVVELTGLLYLIYGVFTGHFRRNLVPPGKEFSGTIRRVLGNHLRFRRPDAAEAASYNVLQRLSYLLVIFALFPLAVWTGLAMSPAIVSVFPALVTTLGGQQSARTIHFLVSLALVLFVVVHIAMIFLAGFRVRMRAMIGGRAGSQ